MERHHHRLYDRLLKAAEQERLAVLKALPADFRERLDGVDVCFEATPSADMVERGASPEILSETNRDERTITVFLMPLYERHGKFLGEFRRELRKVMLWELADWAGLDVDLEAGA